MIWILLNILCSTMILIVFRLGDQVGANTRQIIVIGYPISALSGALIFQVTPAQIFSWWFPLAAIEGIAFYTVFRLMALSAANSGISVTGIAAKMSVVIPITIGITVLEEAVNLPIISGIIFGLIAVWLTIGNQARTDNWRWPLLVFLGTGLVDSSLKIFQVWGLSEPEFPAFLVTVFSFAFVAGLLHHFTYAERSIHHRNWIGGLILGLVNLGSAYFLLKALAIPELKSIFVYSTNNFGTVIFAVLVALLVFHEKITRRGWIGLKLALISIGLLYAGHNG